MMAERSEQHRRMKGRNLILAGLLLAFVVLVFVVALVKFQGAW